MKNRPMFVMAVISVMATLMFMVGCAGNTNQSQVTVPMESARGDQPEESAVPAVAQSEPKQQLDPAPVQTSEGIDEIIKLAKAGVAESVVLQYIDNSLIAYDPGAEEILYLNDIGISVRVISAILRHGRQMRERMTAQPVALSAAEAAAESAEAPPAPAEPAPVPEAAAATMAEAVPVAAAVTEGIEAQPTTEVVYEVPATMPETVQVYYPELSPYGTWVDLDGYGWCWQPTVVTVNPGWAPYCDGGRWVYTDCGWYWASSYSWGWAPFHYGRWFRHYRCGWMWAPDSVWGPAWVSWRYMPGYCGWAPLPPGAHFGPHGGWSYCGSSVGVTFGFGLGHTDYTFVHARHFGSAGWHSHRLPHSESHRVYKNSVVINNYIKGDKNVVINGGVGNERLRPFRNSDFKPIPVRDIPPGAGQVLKPDRIETRNGKEILVRRQLQESIPQPPKIITAQKPLNRGSGSGSGPALVSGSLRRDRPSAVEATAVHPATEPSGIAPVSTQGVPVRSMAPPGNRTRQESSSAAVTRAEFQQRPGIVNAGGNARSSGQFQVNPMGAPVAPSAPPSTAAPRSSFGSPRQVGSYRPAEGAVEGSPVVAPSRPPTSFRPSPGNNPFSASSAPPSAPRQSSVTSSRAETTSSPAFNRPAPVSEPPSMRSSPAAAVMVPRSASPSYNPSPSPAPSISRPQSPSFSGSSSAPASSFRSAPSPAPSSPPSSGMGSSSSGGSSRSTGSSRDEGSSSSRSSSGGVGGRSGFGR